MTLSIYHTEMSVCSVKVRAQLAEKGIEWESHTLDLRAGDQKKSTFLALNPKGLVPVLKHDDTVVTESNIIMEYIEEAFPTKVKLFPASPAERAQVRAWMQRLDTGLHLNVATISVGISLRGQFLAVNDTPEKVQAYIKGIPDPGMRSVWQESGLKGMDSPAFAAAVQNWRRTLVDMNSALKSSNHLVGNTLTLADFAFMPYVCRLENLQLEEVWVDLPNVAHWLRRVKSTKGFTIGLEKWLLPSGLATLKETGAKARDAVLKIARPDCER